ncbi:MAG: alpha/beta hydrolase [Gammaproteobacteria bacterium]|nr:MAG: alpha/beta hydrolase [Gammaproteobacteria bacterium]UTW42122.1 alpha/beta hydrolase [bacterium SCSIO 12844]
MNKLSINHYQINYIDSQKGNKTFLLIHGTGANHQQLLPQYHYLSKFARVVAVDLKGHGESDKPQKNYSINGFANDLAYLIKKLDLQNITAIGASMGGNIAVDLAYHYPKLISSIILLDSGLLYSKDMLATMIEYKNELKTNFTQCINKIADNSFLKTDQHKSKLLHTMLNTPEYVWSGCFENMIAIDQRTIKSTLNQLKLPVLYIQATNCLTNLDLFKQLTPQLQYAKIIGAGHIISLEVADQVNAMIMQFEKINQQSFLYQH